MVFDGDVSGVFFLHVCVFMVVMVFDGAGGVSLCWCLLVVVGFGGV